MHPVWRQRLKLPGEYVFQRVVNRKFISLQSIAYLPSVFILNFDTRGVSFGPAFQGKKSGSVY